MTADGKLIILSSGGTGGHVFPAQALAENLLAQGHRLALITDRRGNSYGESFAGVETRFIQAAGISGRGPLTKGVALFRLAIGFFQSRNLLRDMKPDVVVGFGGYPTIPTMLAASHLKIKTVIHEQNAVLGRANRVLAPRASRIATAFKTTAFLRDADLERTVWTGNPVRPEILAIRNNPYPPLDAESPIHMLVTGGSQGASIFSKVVPEALAALPDGLRRRIRITQQCRREDIDSVRAAYARTETEAVLAPFFNDIPGRLSEAHLVICRAGASTTAELSCAGRPAILVPYPHAIDDHQTANAARFCDSGGAWMIPDSDFTPTVLSDRLKSLFSVSSTLEMAARCAARSGMPEAAERLANLVLGVIRENGNGAHATLREEAA
ncbi:MAG: undecaprenyldiphospho-muramoylpentapeptide beta-N-acetylglucosaminyltransferase [Alphaproteobacteria bacterium]